MKDFRHFGAKMLPIISNTRATSIRSLSDGYQSVQKVNPDNFWGVIEEGVERKIWWSQEALRQLA